MKAQKFALIFTFVRDLKQVAASRGFFISFFFLKMTCATFFMYIYFKNTDGYQLGSIAQW